MYTNPALCSNLKHSYLFIGAYCNHRTVLEFEGMEVYLNCWNLMRRHPCIKRLIMLNMWLQFHTDASDSCVQVCKKNLHLRISDVHILHWRRRCALDWFLNPLFFKLTASEGILTNPTHFCGYFCFCLPLILSNEFSWVPFQKKKKRRRRLLII